jgi:hypothetical protein
MPSCLRHLRSSIIILTLAALTFGVGGKAKLCFMPDGDVHLEQSHAHCTFAEEADPAEATALISDHCDPQGACLDVALGGDASHHHLRDIVQLAPPALVPLGPPIILALTDPNPVSPLAIVPLPQLISLQSVVLLI